MKFRNPYKHLTHALTYLLLSCSPLIAQDTTSNQQQFLTIGNETYIQINNVLVKSSKVVLELGNETFVNIDKLVVLDSVASFKESSSDTVIAKNNMVTDDVVVVTRYDSDKELVRATVAMSPALAEADVEATVAGNDITSEDMFGYRGGYIHPFLSIIGEYTDNLYNINIDQRDNLLTVISPGVWMGVPRIKELPLTLTPYNAAVGGTRFTQAGSGSFNRFQTYLLGALDYKVYSEESALDYTAWRVEGMYQQNLPAGISVRLLDRYTKDRDKFDLGSFTIEDFSAEQNSVYLASEPSFIRDYSNNIAQLGINLDMSERFSGLFNYSNFWLDYDEQNDEWLDRVDNSFDISMSYHHSPKTTISLHYAHSVVSYENNESNDGENVFIGAGINWKNSSKSALMFRGGYQYREFSNIDEETTGTFSMEGQFNYLVTDKTKVAVNVYKAIEETDNIRNTGMDTTAVKLRYDQRFSHRIQAFMEVWHEEHDYEGFLRPAFSALNSEARKDTWFSVQPGLQYFFREWLAGEISYTYENRNSNINVYDFTTQTVLLSLNISF